MIGSRKTIAAAIALIAVGCLFGSAVVSARSGGAKEVRPLRAGFVSTDALRQRWTTWQEKAKEMSDRRQKVGTQLADHRKKLEEIKSAAQSATGEKKPQLDADLIQAQRTIEDLERSARVDIDRDSAHMLQDLYSRMQTEIRSLAKDRDLDVVYVCPTLPDGKVDAQTPPILIDLYLRSPAQMPVYLKDDMNLTNELVDRLNRR